MDRTFTIAGAALAALAVILGAFGAHALRPRLDPAQLAAFETGARYHMYHALALLAAAAAAAHWPGPLTRAAGWLFIAGTLLFSGSLYALALGGPAALGPVTPLGGLCLIAGWTCLAIGAARGR